MNVYIDNVVYTLLCGYFIRYFIMKHELIYINPLCKRIISTTAFRVYGTAIVFTISIIITLVNALVLQ